MNSDPISTWRSFLASGAAANGAMPPLELDGYLTGILVSPDLLPPSRWLEELWGEDEPAFDSDAQAQAVMGAVMECHKAIAAALDAGFEQIEAKQPLGYKPLFLAGEGKPDHDAVRAWVRGFDKAVALAKQGWMAIVDDARLRPLLAPIIAFSDLNNAAIEPEAYTEADLDEAAAEIPHDVTLLRKVAKFMGQNRAGRRSKLGRNDPCACGSGLKYKRCCGSN